MQNDMRDRLVDLLYEAEGQVNNDYPTVEQIADHLIANGVILPPCKVGDKVYGFEYPRKDIVVINEETVEELCFEIETDEGWYHISEIGKRVFLTKEEAEQKLKELSENGNL